MRISVLAKPNKRTNRAYWQDESLAQTREGVLVVEVSAPPVDGKANEKIIEQIAAFFGISKSSVTLVRGSKGKLKVFEIETK